MNVEIPTPVLKGKKALVVGIANEQSIAYGCAKAFHELGADVAITYANEKAKPFLILLKHSKNPMPIKFMFPIKNCLKPIR